MTVNEKSIFYKDLFNDNIGQYIKDHEIEDLVQAVGLSNPEAFVKKHMVWAWHQIIIANFFASHILSRECPKKWGFASEESTWKFLTTASAYFEKYTHLHTKDNTKNLYLRVCNLTNEGKENLGIANSILTLIHEKIMAFPSQEKKLSRIPKNTTEWQYFLLENISFVQSTIHRYCIDLLGGGYHYYTSSNFNTLFTGYMYPNRDLKIYKEEVSENFLRFLKVLIMFAYSYNNKKWVAPRSRNIKTYNETVNFFDSVYKYHGDNLEFLGSLIEGSLPKGNNNNNYDIKEYIPVVKFGNEIKKGVLKTSNKLPIRKCEMNKVNAEPTKIPVNTEVKMQPTKVEIELPVQEVSKEKPILTFNLFGYKFSLNKEIQKPIEDEFEEFMEF